MKPKTRRTADAEIRDTHPRRCSAKLSDGSRQCRKYAVKGATVCPTHGGRAPQVKKSARERLHELAEPAVTALSAALGMVEKHPGIALNPSVQRAALGVLDRCGLGPSSHVSIESVTQAHGEEIASILLDVLAAFGVELDAARRKAIRGRLDAEGEGDAAVAKWRRENPPPPKPKAEKKSPRFLPRGEKTAASQKTKDDEKDEVLL